MLSFSWTRYDGLYELVYSMDLKTELKCQETGTLKLKWPLQLQSLSNLQTLTTNSHQGHVKLFFKIYFYLTVLFLSSQVAFILLVKSVSYL